MKKSREGMKEELLEVAKKMIEKVVDWSEKNEQAKMREIEGIVEGIQREFGVKMAEKVIEQQEEARGVPGPKCSKCGKEMHNKGSQSKQVTSWVGELRLKRRYYYCEGCKEGRFPLDEELELCDTHWSERVVQEVVWVSGVVDSYAAGEAVLKRIGKLSLSDTSVWRRVEKWGGVWSKVDEENEKKANALPSPEDVFQLPQAEIPRLGAAMDGAMVNIRQEGWKELKVGCLFEIEQQPTLDGTTQEMVEQGHAIQTTYVAHLGGPERFGRLLWKEAQHRGWEHATDTQVVGDGAAWIWNLSDLHLAPNQQTVDWYHATEHLHTAAQLAYPNESAAAVRWYNACETLLFQGQAETVVLKISHLAQRFPAQAAALASQALYFEHNKRRMNYMELREDGYLIGSGVVESAAKQFKARFTGPGMRWSRDGLSHLLPIRSAVMGDTFDLLWPSIYSFSLN